eukprot:gene20452-26537_t
MQRKICLIMI